MRNIGVIDVDLIGRQKNKFPNLALMKISGFEKDSGSSVDLITDYADIDRKSYDKIYASKVFTDTKMPESITTISGIEYGGTGFFYDKAPPLRDEIEHHMPDYDLYKPWARDNILNGDKKLKYEYYLSASIGFTTRGCFRHCPFCVNRNLNRVVTHSPVSEFLNRDKKLICLLDDNIMGSPDFKKIWTELDSLGIKFEYKQGMDFRLLNSERIKLIDESKNYRMQSLIFAFDNIEDAPIIVDKLNLMRSITMMRSKFYILCAFDRKNVYDDAFYQKDIIDTFERISILMKYGCIPYIMRYEKWEDTKYKSIYSSIMDWCNYPPLFFKKSYREYVQAKTVWTKNENCAARKALDLMEKDMPEVKKYLDLRLEDTCEFDVNW